MTIRQWQNITNYMDTVGTTLKTFSFNKTQNLVRATLKGNANVTYTIGSQSGTLTPGQSITVTELITSFNLTAVSGTQTVEVYATEDGTQQKESSVQLPEVATIQKNQMNFKAFQDSLLSVTNSKAGYDDTNSSIFTESWANLTAWSPTAANGTQVSAGNLYGGSVPGAGSGMNHSFALAAGDNMRAVFPVTILGGAGTGGIIIGVSSASAGTAPASGAGDAFGIYLYSSAASIQQMSGGVATATIENPTLSAGNYICTVTVDPIYISVSATKTDGTVEAAVRRLRSGFSINNVFVFNSDSRGLTGSYVGAGAVRKGLQTITPRTFGEGQAKTIQWTGDGSTYSARIFLPPGYDSRIPSPLVICWHGNGTDETSWSTNGNYSSIQKALVAAGYIVLSVCGTGQAYSWGNTAATAAYYKAYQFVRNNYAIGAVVWFANSMGGIESLNALSENLIPCAAWAATSPTFNLLTNYQNSMFTSVISTSYGIASDGSNYGSTTNGRDPNIMHPSAFRGVPMWLACAVDDTAVPKLQNGDLLENSVSDTAIEINKIAVASGGHSFSISPYTSQIVNFFNKYIKS